MSEWSFAGADALMLLGEFISSFRPAKDADRADRLNYCWIPFFLFSYAVFIIGWSFCGYPIACWFPAYFMEPWIYYGLDYCFVQNTYWLPFETVAGKSVFDLGQNLIEIPTNVTERDERQISYYQWVGFVLLAMAVLFHLPILFWRAMYQMRGIPIESLAALTKDEASFSAFTRSKNIDTMSRFLDQSLVTGEGVSAFGGRYLALLYLFVKFWFLANGVVNFVILQYFLGFDTPWWGAMLTYQVFSGNTWMHTGHFPRVTLCDLEVRVLGNVHRHTSQCSLMLNLFNEAGFTICWWFFLFVIVYTGINMLQWLSVMALDSSGFGMVSGYLSQIEPELSRQPRRRVWIRRFIRRCLKADGLTVLRLIRTNCGDVCVKEVVESLWKSFKERFPELSDTEPAEALQPKVTLASSNNSPKTNYDTDSDTSPLRPPTYDESVHE